MGSARFAGPCPQGSRPAIASAITAFNLCASDQNGLCFETTAATPRIDL
jgi:hypothetical protein